jgi:hypothetical protein
VSVEALWSIEFWASFDTNAMERGEWGAVKATHAKGRGSGVVVLDAERVRGGDYSYTYVGDYKVTGDQITVQMRVRRYRAHAPHSVFSDLDDFSVTLAGPVGDSEMRLFGESPQVPGQQLLVHFIRQAELP